MPLTEGTGHQSVEPFPDSDFAAFERMRSAIAEPEEEAPEATEGDEPTEAPEPAPESDPEEDQDNSDDRKPKSDRGWQRQVDKLTKKLRVAEAELATANQPGVASPNPTANEPAKDADDPEPDPDKFTDYEKYVEEKVRWKDRVEAKAQAKVAADNKAKADAEKTIAEYSARVKELVKQPDYADFGTKVSPLSTKLHPAIAEAILTDDNGPQVAYAVASDAKLLERLEGMSLPQAIRELGKLSAKFDKAPEPKHSAVPAPKPPKPVTAVSAPSRSVLDTDIDYADFERRRNAQIKRRG